MASLHALRQARAVLVTMPNNYVSLLNTGAHLAHLSKAVEGRVSDLWSAGLFIERHSLGGYPSDSRSLASQRWEALVLRLLPFGRYAR